MSEVVPYALRRFIRMRAANRCEYCLLHEEDSFYPHQPDHIIAIKHQGETIESNLAWACHECNRMKGSDLTSVDPKTSRIVRLFNPRSDRWDSHFRLRQGRIVPLTSIGRVSVFLLRLNSRRLIEMRRILTRQGRYPR
jgi:hypothetical protein